jgi:predicted TIM-barrel enzyme
LDPITDDYSQWPSRPICFLEGEVHFYRSPRLRWTGDVVGDLPHIQSLNNITIKIIKVVIPQIKNNQLFAGVLVLDS